MQNDHSAELLEIATNNGFAMLKDLDFYEEMKVLDFGFFDWNKKRNSLKEFRALSLALWKFALVQSFPSTYNEIYTKFLNAEWAWNKNDRSYIIEYSDYYFEKLSEKGLDDFTVIAKHVLSFAKFDEAKTKAYTLKLALLFRAKYKFFFENLL